MAETIFDPKIIRISRHNIETAIKESEFRIKEAKRELKKLQESCPHQNQHSESEYNALYTYCLDCNKVLSILR